MGDAPLLELKNICKSYSKGKWSSSILNNVSMSIEQGEMVRLKGKSGSGKSTIARIIARLESFDHGSILFRGVDYSNFNNKKMQKIRGDVASILQHSKSSFSPYYRLKTLVMAPALFYNKRDKTMIENELEEMLAWVNLDRELLNKRIDEVSGGEAECLALFRALLGEPSLLIMDEGVNGLDLMIKLTMLNKLQEINRKKNIAYLFVSHDFNDKIIINSKTYVIDGGILTQELG